MNQTPVREQVEETALVTRSVKQERIEMPRIQEFINNKHKYEVDYTYQRPNNAWSKEDNQCLIDTILKGEPMPIFFLNFISDQDKFFIVDGQQRLTAIRKFYDNELKLNGKFSGVENHGKTFNGDNPISDEQREIFLNYSLTFKMLEDYDDERIRLIFSRLQRGKQLQLGERLNALPGAVVMRMREIAHHEFMSKSIGVYQGRYGNYPDAARILFYEKYGAKQCGSPELYRFFDENREISKSDRIYKSAIGNLNFLLKCFPSSPGNYSYLEKHAWVIAVYTMIRELRLNYSLIGREDDVKKYVESFHAKVYSEDFRNSNVDYQRFYDNIRGGWSERIIAIRRDILIKDFLQKHALKDLDSRRQISREEKIQAYGKAPYCSMCKKTFNDFSEPEYHHSELYSAGGKTSIDNIVVLCAECHKKVHGKGELALPLEEEKTEDDI